MNILVTGGAGFIGSHTVVALAEAGFTPIIMDDFSNSKRSVLEGLEHILGKKVRFYDQDCNDMAAMRQILRDDEIGGVIHFAAFKAVGESMSEPLRYYQNNVGSLLVLLEAMEHSGVSNLIFSSSCTVYGNPDHLPVTEMTPVQPAMSVYGNTKQIGEEILRDLVAADKYLKVIALRYFNPIGAHVSARIGELPLGVPNNLVPFITQTAAGLREQLTVFGNDYATSDGTCVRDYIHVMDLAEAHVSALQHIINTESSVYDVYNVGTGQGNSVLELIHTFEAVTGKPLHYSVGPRRSGDVPAVYSDVTKMTSQLGWTAKRNLREALEDAWRWQMQITD